MDKFSEMQTFNAVVDCGSFVKAADTMNLSKAAVSRHLAALEARLGVRLLHRTTRRLALTDEGQAFYERGKELLASLDEIEAEVTSGKESASGLLRINAPVTFGILQLAPLWSQFKTLNPHVSLDVTLNDRVVDLVEEGYDVAIRIAALENSSLVSRRLASARMLLCASPQYLQTHGTPLHPSELGDHAVIAYSYLSTKDEWQFSGPDGAVTVKTRPSFHTNSGDTCRVAALAHQGIILQPSFLVAPDLQQGTLVPLLAQYRAAEPGIYAVYPTRKHVPAKVRNLIDFLAARFKKQDALWGWHGK